MPSPFKIYRGLRLALSAPDLQARGIKAVHEYSAVVDIASIAADTDLTVSVTLTGVAVGDYVIAQAPAALEANLQVGAPWVSAANTVKFVVENETAGAIDPASATWKFLVIKML